MSGFVGTGVLVRLVLRRDRIRLPVGLAVFVVMAASAAAATAGLYPTPAARVQAADSFNHAQSLVALYGRVYDPTSIGALAMVKLGGIGAVFVAVLAILLVVRHTRADEEAGRLELVGATAVGRQAPLTAALLAAVGTNLALGVLPRSWPDRCRATRRRLGRLQAGLGGGGGRVRSDRGRCRTADQQRPGRGRIVSRRPRTRVRRARRRRHR